MHSFHCKIIQYTSQVVTIEQNQKESNKESNRIESNRIESNRIESNLNRIESNRIEVNRIKSSELHQSIGGVMQISNTKTSPSLQLICTVGV
jgi:hypothetical protein